MLLNQHYVVFVQSVADCPPTHPPPRSPPRPNSHVCVFLAKPLDPFCPGQQTGGQSVNSQTLSVLKKSGATEPPRGHISTLHHSLMFSRDEFPDGFVEVPVSLCVLSQDILSHLNEPFCNGSSFFNKVKTAHCCQAERLDFQATSLLKTMAAL